MHGSSLKRLAEICDISKLDLNPGSVTLAPIDGGLLAYYQGLSSVGGITVSVSPLTNNITKPVSVSAAEFRDLAPLFDTNAELKLVATESGLTIRAGERRVTLQYNRAPDIERYRDLTASPPTAWIDGPLFLKEINLAAQVCATTMVTPILTGIRVIVSPTMLGIQSANGSSSVFESAIPCEAQERREFVAPAQDLQLALKLIDDDDLYLCLSDRHMTLRGSDAVIRIPLISGTWPQIGARLKEIVFDDKISLPVTALRSLIIASRAYRTSSDVVIRPTEAEGSLVLETKESQFQEILPGHVSRTYILDVDDLETATRVTEGELTLSLSSSMALATAKNRKLYMSQRAQ